MELNVRAGKTKCMLYERWSMMVSRSEPKLGATRSRGRSARSNIHNYTYTHSIKHKLDRTPSTVIWSTGSPHSQFSSIKLLHASIVTSGCMDGQTSLMQYIVRWNKERCEYRRGRRSAHALVRLVRLEPEAYIDITTAEYRGSQKRAILTFCFVVELEKKNNIIYSTLVIISIII